MHTNLLNPVHKHEKQDFCLKEHNKHHYPRPHRPQRINYFFDLIANTLGLCLVMSQDVGKEDEPDLVADRHLQRSVAGLVGIKQYIDMLSF